MYYSALEDYYIKQRKSVLLEKAITISDEIIKEGNLDNKKITCKKEFNKDFKDISQKNYISIRIINGNGIVVESSEKNEIGKKLVIEDIIQCLNGEYGFCINNKNKQMYLYLPVIKNNDKQSVDNIMKGIYITSSTEDIYKPLIEVRETIIIILVIVVLFEILLSLYISRILVKPLSILKKTIDKITQGYLNEKVIITGKDEIAEIGNTINKMTDRLLEIDNSRKEFVSNVSHELKTPLSSIKVLTESLMLQDNINPEIYKEFLCDINSEIDRQNEIINDLLQLVKVDSKKAPLVVELININQLLIEIVNRLRPLAFKKNIDLIIDRVDKVFIEVDSLKMTLALSNIIENAIKYNVSNGRVTIIIDSDRYNGYIRISDTGIGIPIEYQEKIFERFYRVDKMRDRATGGTGLGLAISQGVIQRHNGSIKAISKEQVGTTFLVTLPLKQNLKKNNNK